MRILSSPDEDTKYRSRSCSGKKRSPSLYHCPVMSKRTQPELKKNLVLQVPTDICVNVTSKITLWIGLKFVIHQWDDGSDTSLWASLIPRPSQLINVHYTVCNMDVEHQKLPYGRAWRYIIKCMYCVMCTWVEPSGRVVVVVESTGVLGYGKSVWFAARRNNRCFYSKLLPQEDLSIKKYNTHVLPW